MARHDVVVAPSRSAAAAYALAGAASLLAVAAVGGAVLVGLDWRTAVDSFLVTNVAIGVSAAPCGLLVARARPGNPVGWLLLGLGIAPLITAASVPVVVHATGAGWSHEALRWLVTLYFLGWPWGTGLCLPLLLQLFPTGRPVSARWRVLLQLTVVSGVVSVLGIGPTPEMGASTYLLPPGHEVLGAVAGLLTPLVLLASVASLAVRYATGGRTVREQLLWLLLAALLAVGINQPWSWSFLPPQGGTILLILAVPLIPLAVTVAVLRHELFDVRLAVSRTLLYGILTAAVVGVYAGLVAVLDRVVRGTGAPVLAALAVALAFNPARVRLQRLVDRALFGARRDPVRAVSAVGERMAGDDLDGVLTGLREALRLPFAALRDSSRELASSGDPPLALHTLPLLYQGGAVGELVVGARPGETRLSPADATVLGLLSTPLAVALHATALSEQLRASRARLVTAAEEERRRLHRELHDGLGPTLTGAALKADAATNMAGDPVAVARLTTQLGDEIRRAITDIRRLVYGLHPADLDELGLVEALRRLTDRPGHLRLAVQAPQDLPELPAAVEVAAYRIATEAVTNVHRHTDATSVTIELSTAGGTEHPHLQVVITDDGTRSGQWRPGVGLRSIHERAAELGGTAETGPTPTGGRVLAALPLHPASQRSPELIP